MPKQVICNGKLFNIDSQGRRVWLETPPGEVLTDIHYDQKRAELWPKLWKEK
jgi:hypothetical protein